MGALRKAQFEYDNRLPGEHPDDVAERAWIDNAAADLLEGRDVTFKRRLRSSQGVTFDQFAVAVDEFLMGQLSGSGMSPSVLGRLVLAAKRKDSSEASSAADEAIASADPTEALQEIARTLLRPLARDGLIAQAEDAEL
ncbi:hypothetical protein DM813_19010 [Pseudomonas alkylphenolica]|uniref:Uncharacterized protein n=1 Tax=Pseudomonas alkylphenolica TaxID=237609 RepID=A0A443ZQB6_9PSED|nr:hypothetical protein [Pseudomonas alkylphenolica]RWU21280.1 hypothetical protein DM813_19010 [Pseudomonas alkylphenolica]